MSTTIVTQQTEITQFIFGQPLSLFFPEAVQTTGTVARHRNGGKARSNETPIPQAVFLI
jgi:hypothetical protein